MQTISTIEALREIRREWQLAGKRIGFVPTMGNLHAGHLSLVSEAKKHADIVVVSIFVNPLQFGADEDLDNYPRTLEQDSQQLAEMGVDVLFTPSVDAIYPRGLEQQTFVEVPGISYMICGASRPGHFRGVATIVSKLFNMVQPNSAFFGEKDYQQLQVVTRLARDLDLPIEVVGCPTIREEDGLAMSSRNLMLSDRARTWAPELHRAMEEMSEGLRAGGNLEVLRAVAVKRIERAGFTQVEYLDLRSADRLELMTTPDRPARPVRPDR